MISIDYDTPPVRQPGDFRRRGIDGPPIVPSLTKTRQPTGNKAELVAKCEARGIDLTDFDFDNYDGVHPSSLTVAQLKEALGPEPADETYGRPSGFGDPLENSYALRKWIERGIARGVLMLVADGLDVNRVDLDDDGVLDRIVLDAQDAADAMVWADRGTFVHSLIERFEQDRPWHDLVAVGEALDIPRTLQNAILAAWENFRAQLGLTAIRCELPMVNDGLRIAGTLDLLDLTTRPLVTEFGTIDAGRAVIADVKTGDLRDKYAVQIAGYQGGVPFDVETEQRATWPTQPVADIGLIYHMSMKAVLDGAPVVWEAIPVDLAAGRDGARICCEARDWPAAPVFGAAVALGEVEAASPVEFVKTAVPGCYWGLKADPSPTPTRAELRHRKDRMAANANDTGWGAEFERQWKAHGINKASTDVEVKAALDAIEPPFDPDPQVQVEGLTGGPRCPKCGSTDIEEAAA